MKIYEKPLAKIEKILVEDVITASGDAPVAPADVINGELSNNAAITNIVGGEETVIVFEW